VASSSDNQDFDGIWVPARLRSSKDASELLEGLRTAYQSLSASKRQEVKALILRVFESQRRTGLPIVVAGPAGIETATN